MLRCADLAAGSCSSASALDTVQRMCLGKQECTITASSSVFGTHCPQQHLVVRATGCSPAHNKKWIFDFGQNMAGVATLVVPSTATVAGTPIVLKYGEVLRTDGSVDMAFCGGGGGASCHCSGINCANQTDQYWPHPGVDEQSFTPEFTYHGYVRTGGVCEG